MKRILFGLFCAVLAMTGCAQLNPLGSVEDDSGALGFAMNTDPAQEIATGTVTVTKGGMTFTRPIVIANYTGTVTLSGLQVGRWNILVQLYDAEGYEIYTGEAQAVVNKNQTTTARIRVNQNTGTLQVIVDVPFLVISSGCESIADIEAAGGVIKNSIAFELGLSGNAVRATAARSGVWFQGADFTGMEDDGTIEFWFKSDSPSTSVSVGPLVSVEGDPRNGNGGGGIMNVTMDAGGLLTMDILYPSSMTRLSAQLSFAANEWHHLAFTWNSGTIDGTHTAAIYVDGVRAAQTSVVFPFLNCQPSCGTSRPDLSAGHGVISLFGNGWDITQPSATRVFNGVIDCLKVWQESKVDFSDR
jgi:hypothetical protein